MTHTTRRKIAILGGGMAALAAAFELSEGPEPPEITVYQQGWRLGGKGASGRNREPGYGARIEEHGLHVWTGLYDNAFRLIRRCYAELNRPADAPLATWCQAFKPQRNFVIREHFRGRWIDWPFAAPANNLLPGEPNAGLSLPLRSYALMAFRVLREALLRGEGEQPTLAQSSARQTRGRASRLARQLGYHVLRWSSSRMLRHPQLTLDIVGGLMRRRWEKVRTRIEDDDVRRNWTILNFLYGNLRGFIADHILERGFDAIEDHDYRSWLRKYVVEDTIAGQELTLFSPLVLFMYESGFAYLGGDLNSPNLAAGTALRTLIRLSFTWKGAVIWKMQAGMGETVFTPLYEVLRRRGVRFKFFHRVTHLAPSADGGSISAITIRRQVDLVDPEAEYQPLINIKGLDCWPSSPLDEQIVPEQRQLLREQGLNLETCGDRWEDAGTLVLRHGKDFDQVVLGIPIAALPPICGDLVALRPAWRAMLDNVQTIRTQAMQLWLDRSTEELGWHGAPQPIFTLTGIGSLNTWADMSYLMERETWEGGPAPRHCTYFCGPLRDTSPTAELTGTCQEPSAAEETAMEAEVHQNALKLLREHIGSLWPSATVDGSPTELDWSALHDRRADAPDGAARLASQYLRTNIHPSERYVLTVSGSTRHRIKPGESGFSNLALAGDWTDNGFNTGCIEAATMSGMLASNALSGFPKRETIVGLNFGRRGAARF